MSIFVAKLENHVIVQEFFSETIERKEQAMVNVDAKLKKTPSNILWVNVTTVKIPPIYYFALLFVACFLFFGGWFWFLPIVFFSLTYLFFWRGFHVWAFKRGLRKSGYTGEIKILSIEEGLLEVYFN